MCFQALLIAFILLIPAYALSQDSDGDGLTDAIEDSYCTGSTIADTDGDVYTSGFGVVFQVGSSSTGTAEIWGGDGAKDGDRYDFSGPVADSGKARVTLRIKTAGTIYMEPYIPECDSGAGAYQGRYCPEIPCPDTITIQGVE